MKTKLQILAVLMLLSVTLQTSFAINEEYGVKRYYQPNGASFLGRDYADEFGHYYQTAGGYLFAYNEQDRHYYYVVIDASGNLLSSQFKVGIDDPGRHGIRKDIFNSSEWRAKVARARGVGNDPGAFKRSGPATISSVPSSIYLQVILVEFSDIKHQNPTDWPMPLGYGGTKPSYSEYTAAQFTNLLFSLDVYNTTSPDGEPVYGSMRDYYRDMSLSALTLTGALLNQVNNGIPRWVILSNTKMYYHNQSWAGNFEQFLNAVLAAAQAQQGIVPASDATHKLCVIYAGNMYVDGQLHPAMSGNVYIMSERFKYPPPSIPRNSEVNDATFSHIGVHSHEFGHILGLGDQYYAPYDYGLWGLMANGGNKGGDNNSQRGNNPAPIVPQQRYELGWLSFQNTDSKALNAQIPYSLNTVYKIKGSYSSEYILIENRQTGADWNRFLPTGGLLIWRIYYSTVDLIEAAGVSSAPYASGGDPFPGTTNARKLNDFSSPSNSKFISGSNSNVLLQNISNSGSTMTADLSPYWYGSIAESQTWSGVVLIGENLSISFGVALILNAGTTLTLSSGVSLTVNGTLNATGTSSSRITFTSNSPSGTWSGIVLSGAGSSNSTLSYCTIERVLTYGGAVLSLLNVPSNPSAGTPVIMYTKILDNTLYGTSGIYFNNSNGYLVRDSILGNGDAGVRCDNQSSPSFGKWGYYFECSGPSNSTISGNAYGVLSYYYSSPWIGSGMNSNVRGNRIYDNTTANVSASSYCYITAVNTWWGQNPPNPTKFVISSDSYLEYSPWCQSPPQPKMDRIESSSEIALSNLRTGETDASLDERSTMKGASDFRFLLNEARERLHEKRFAEATDIYKTIVGVAPESREGLYAVTGLVTVFRENLDPAILSYLESLPKGAGEFQAVSLMALANARACVADAQHALATLQTVRNQFAQTEHGKQALIQTALLCYFMLRDGNGANAALTELEAKYAEDESIAMARWLIKGMGGNGRQGKEESSLSGGNGSIMLQGDRQFQSFPNPFNPSTTIRYQVSQPGHVRLTVIDMLGRQVATLIDEYQPAGSHSVRFDGSSLLSGVYFLRLQAGTAVGVSKMVLAK